MKIILNKCYGGFNVSQEGYELYAKKKGLKLYFYRTHYSTPPLYTKIDKMDIFSHCFVKDFGNEATISDNDFEKYNLYLDSSYRTDPILIEVVEELGDKASGRGGRLRVVEIPDGLDYVIDDYDGIETLHEKVREW